MVEGVALGTFGAELRRRRAAADLSLADLATRLHYSKGYLSKVENGAKLPSRDLATRCDALLRAAGELLALLPGAAATPAPASASYLAEPPDPPGPVVDVAGPLGGVPSGWAAAAGDPATVSAFAGLLGQLRALGRSWPPALLLPTVVSQARSLVYVARAAPPAPVERLFLVAGRFAEYAGWMYQEAGDDREMARWTRLAVRYAQVAGDAPLSVYADVRLAGAAMYQGDAASTVALARRAAERAGTSSRVRGLALHRQAQGHAMLGERGACFRCLDQAREVFAGPEAAPCPEPDGDDGSPGPLGTSAVHQTDLVSGWCLHDLGQPEAAATVLEAQLALLPPTSRRSRARFGSRLALAYATCGAPDLAVSTAERVLPDIRHVDSATVRHDLRLLARSLNRHRGHAAVRALSPRLIETLRIHTDDCHLHQLPQ